MIVFETNVRWESSGGRQRDAVRHAQVCNEAISLFRIRREITGEELVRRTSTRKQDAFSYLLRESFSGMIVVVSLSEFKKLVTS